MLGDGAVAVHPSDERYAPIVGKLCEIVQQHRRLIPIIMMNTPIQIDQAQKSRARMISTTIRWPSEAASRCTT